MRKLSVSQLIFCNWVIRKLNEHHLYLCPTGHGQFRNWCPSALPICKLLPNQVLQIKVWYVGTMVAWKGILFYRQSIRSYSDMANTLQANRNSKICSDAINCSRRIVHLFLRRKMWSLQLEVSQRGSSIKAMFLEVGKIVPHCGLSVDRRIVLRQQFPNRPEKLRRRLEACAEKAGHWDPRPHRVC